MGMSSRLVRPREKDSMKAWIGCRALSHPRSDQTWVEVSPLHHGHAGISSVQGPPCDGPAWCMQSRLSEVVKHQATSSCFRGATYVRRIVGVLLRINVQSE